MVNMIYIPLDERPCNLIYPKSLEEIASDLTLRVPPKGILSHQKKPSNRKQIWKFIDDNIENTDSIIISTEMLLYGGLVPSRIHYLSDESIIEYEVKLRRLKKINPNLRIVGSTLIMRTPSYSSSAEEPDYYAQYGQEIFREGYLSDKKERQSLSYEEDAELENYNATIPKNIIADYVTRREFNRKVNLLNLKLVLEGIIDFLIIPQDDSSPFGYTAKDQSIIYGEIKKRALSNVMVYPGADEAGYTLIAHEYNYYKKKSPKISAFFSSVYGPLITPSFEDRPISETMKAHILAAGLELVDEYENPDIYLAYNTPGKIMENAGYQVTGTDISYSSFRHLPTFVNKISRIASNNIIGICDSAYGNGGDIELLRMLDQQGVFEKIQAYSGWNTNANSLGNCLALLTFAFYHEDQQSVLEKITLRHILDDCFYQSIIRQEVAQNISEKGNVNFSEQSLYVKKRIMDLKKQIIPGSFEKFSSYKVQIEFPWKRIFEIKCIVTDNS